MFLICCGEHAFHIFMGSASCKPASLAQYVFSSFPCMFARLRECATLQNFAVHCATPEIHCRPISCGPSNWVAIQWNLRRKHILCVTLPSHLMVGSLSVDQHVSQQARHLQFFRFVWMTVYMAETVQFYQYSSCSILIAVHNAGGFALRAVIAHSITSSAIMD